MRKPASPGAPSSVSTAGPTRREAAAGMAVAAAGLVVGGSAPARPPARLTALPPSGLDATSPAVIAAAKGLRFGSCITNRPFLHTSAYRALNLKACNTFVHGSALQWHEVQQRPGQPYDFTMADRIYQWGHDAGKAFRGHMLIDWAALPAWVESAIRGATPAQAAAMLTRHVETLCSHYRDRFFEWNVANEPISGGMRSFGWFDRLGEAYLDLAFATAHRIDPATPLTLNQNLVEEDVAFQHRSRDSLLALAQRLRGRGVPLAAIGIEGHLRSDAAIDQHGLDAFFRALGRMGLSFSITELDVDDRGLPDAPGPRDAGVAALIRDFLDVALVQPNCTGLIVWDLSDRDSWITRAPDRHRASGGAQRPTLLDAQYRPKLAWNAVVDALRRAPARKAVIA